MAYSTGTATDQHDLLDKLRVFLTSNGWTQDGWADDTSSYYQPSLSTAGKRLHVHKGSMYFNFRSCVRAFPFSHYTTGSFGDPVTYEGEITGIALNGSTGYNAGNSWDKQPGFPEDDAGKSFGAVVRYDTIQTYWFFLSDDVCHVVVKYATGEYQHFSFGQMEKYGSYTGGYFYAASGTYLRNYLYGGGPNNHAYWAYLPFSSDGSYGSNGGIYFEADSVTKYRGFLKNGSDTFGTYRKLYASGESPKYDLDDLVVQYRGFTHIPLVASPNNFNNVASFWPLYAFYERDDDVYACLGHVPTIRFCNCQTIASESEIVLGSDTWVVFPSHSRDDGFGNLALAIKKVA